MIKKTTILIVIIVIAIAAFYIFLFLNKGGFGQGNAVGVNGVNISKADLNKEIQEQIDFYKSRNQKIPDDKTLQTDVTNVLIDNIIVSQYAAKHKITVSTAEVNNMYAEVVGVFNSHNNITGASDSAFLTQINKMYGMDKTEYQENLRMDILKEKVQESVGEPLTKWLQEQKKTADIKIY